jgi:hypothetical protein
VFKVMDGVKDICDFFTREDNRQGFCHFRGWQVLGGPLLVVNLGEQEFKGIIAHFNTSRACSAATEHVEKILSQVIGGGMFRVCTNKIAIIVDLPPITFYSSVTKVAQRNFF